ncbi:DUF2550 family protein [Cellulomonas soli]|uniref:DUF2550 family protein n=1 Tax=Cellulomonas soli TaxID=931535 RepID=UPI003F878541
MRGLTIVLVCGVALVVLLAAGLWLSRTHTLDRRVGSFRCSVQRRPGGPWSPGVAQYGAGELYWWRRHSLSPRPARRWARRELAVVERHHSESVADVERAGRSVPVYEVTCSTVASEVHLLMAADAYAGLTSWIEATPSRTASVI